ncbi:hypothetical protein [Nitrosococcus wardiae]|uniref:Polymer-forming cytoskeletal protein n=1 Tax=Nitrosococcus wardiae TaxID=1814290 RepID=A0A4P7C160_9GAMM|nr:hypothetical protein [Nitrosococcus wardiae]QBQ55174.1 hypothetical protein E3U44_12145 [Nitrosococcus wardiae]
MMKKMIVLVALVAGMSMATGVLAEGSKIQGSTITNKANIKNSSNIAVGGLLGSAEANQGTVKIKGSAVKGSTISNKADVKNSSNIAVGGLLGGAKANQGSVVVE